LWKELAEAARRHEVDWRWVRGHAGHPQNEYANLLATRAAKDQSISGGLVPSGFEDWIRGQREKNEAFIDFHEWAPPRKESFDPVEWPAL
jgi:ribonuclease HI